MQQVLRGGTNLIGEDSHDLFTPEYRDAKPDDSEFEKVRLTGRASYVRWHMKKDGSRICSPKKN